MAVLCFKGPAVPWLVLQDLSLEWFFKSPPPLFPAVGLFVVMGEENIVWVEEKHPECVTWTLPNSVYRLDNASSKGSSISSISWMTWILLKNIIDSLASSWKTGFLPSFLSVASLPPSAMGLKLSLSISWPQFYPLLPTSFSHPELPPHFIGCSFSSNAFAFLSRCLYVPFGIVRKPLLQKAFPPSPSLSPLSLMALNTWGPHRDALPLCGSLFLPLPSFLGSSSLFLGFLPSSAFQPDSSWGVGCPGTPAIDDNRLRGSCGTTATNETKAKR